MMMVNNRMLDFTMVMIEIIVNNSDTDGRNNNDHPPTNSKYLKNSINNSFRKSTRSNLLSWWIFHIDATSMLESGWRCFPLNMRDWYRFIDLSRTWTGYLTRFKVLRTILGRSWVFWDVSMGSQLGIPGAASFNHVFPKPSDVILVRHFWAMQQNTCVSQGRSGGGRLRIRPRLSPVNFIDNHGKRGYDQSLNGNGLDAFAILYDIYIYICMDIFFTWSHISPKYRHFIDNPHNLGDIWEFVAGLALCCQLGSLAVVKTFFGATFCTELVT
jgi:hypothetical protein